MVQKLYFVRHAESEANVQDVLAGQLDYPLSEKGRQDAWQVAIEFHRMSPVQYIFSSPLERALQTAEMFAALAGVAIQQNRCLLEQNLGRFSGMTYADVSKEDGYEHDRGKRWHWIPEGGGESYMMLAQRLRPFFSGLRHLPDNADVLIVTHAVTMRIIRALLENTIPQYPLEIARNSEIWQTAFRGLGTPHKITSILLGDAKNTAHRA